jgi:hypothetical protein
VSALVDVERRRALPGVGGVRYDALIATLCLLFQGGAYLDVWAHVHRPELETFFTPWHAVLYTGFFAVAAATVAPLVWRRAPGTPWARAMPAGYDWSLIGVLVFLLGGVLDMLWHVVFGIEADVEALLSPSHLVLALGSTLILTGPLRAAWRRADARVASWPAVLALGFLLSAFSFWTQYAHHFGRPWPAAGNRPTAAAFPVVAPDPLFRNMEIQSLYIAHALGVASILLQAALLSAVVLIAVRRWGPRLPAGAFAVIFGLNALMVAAARDQVSLVPGAIAAGLVADGLLRVLRPSPVRAAAFRAFAFAVPAVYFALYFAGLALTRGVWWSLPLWSGAIVLAGTVGWLASWLVAPPAVDAGDNVSDAPRESHAAERHSVRY